MREARREVFVSCGCILNVDFAIQSRMIERAFHRGIDHGRAAGREAWEKSPGQSQVDCSGKIELDGARSGKMSEAGDMKIGLGSAQRSFFDTQLVTVIAQANGAGIVELDR